MCFVSLYPKGYTLNIVESLSFNSLRFLGSALNDSAFGHFGRSWERGKSQKTSQKKAIVPDLKRWLFYFLCFLLYFFFSVFGSK